MEAIFSSEENKALLLETGYWKAAYRMTDKEDITVSLNIHFSFAFNKAEMDQFREGLQTCDVLDALKKHKEVLKHFFIFDKSSTLTARKLHIIQSCT